MLMLNMEPIRGVINKLYLFRPFIRHHYGMSERNLFCSAPTQKAQGGKKKGSFSVKKPKLSTPAFSIKVAGIP